MNSLRRLYLDKLLHKYTHLIKGKVLDLGGKKEGKKGSFDISCLEADVTYLNIDKETNPDILSNAELIPVEDDYFDTVIATELLEYVPDVGKVLGEIYRVSKEKSNIIISIPFLHPIHGDYWQDRHRLTALQIDEISKNAGFKVCLIEPMGSVGSVVFDLLRVSFGYASKSRLKNIYLFILGFFRLFFQLLDGIFRNQRAYINTGYFILLTK